MGSTSLWQAELKNLNSPFVANPLQNTVETEVAVIGAGITGSATALWLARAGVQITVRNHEYAESFIEELEQSGWSCGYQRNGTLKLAAHEPEFTQINESATLLNEDGWEVKVVQQNDLPSRLRKAYFGGTFYPANGELHPAKYVTGLALLAHQAGASFYDESPVVKIAVLNDGVLLSTPRIASNILSTFLHYG